MVSKNIVKFGEWPSPVGIDAMAAQSSRPAEPRLDGTVIYWLESRPAEGGRVVLCKKEEGAAAIDLTPLPYNVRSRVHEYGGGAYVVSEGVPYFVNFADQAIYSILDDGEITRVAGREDLRFADFVPDTRRHRLVCIREDHSTAGQPENTLVAVSCEGDEDGTVLARGADFYSSPTLSPDGELLAWLEWDHPDMPWDSTRLKVARVLSSGLLGEPYLVAGGYYESVFQPQWSPGGVLHYVSDRTGWWNIYAIRSGETVALTRGTEEHGVPSWAFGLSTYAFGPNEELYYIAGTGGEWTLHRLTYGARKPDTLAVPYTDVQYLRASEAGIVFTGASALRPAAVIFWPRVAAQPYALTASTTCGLTVDGISRAQTMKFPTTKRKRAYANFYPPVSASCEGPKDELPPMIVLSHGGPTGVSAPSFSLKVQFWTSRGFAVLDVNYGGSAGYGREYRERLKKSWGIVDVDDCVNAARHVTNKHLADGRRIAIMGGSAGGYTTLACLAFRRFFKAGVCLYGVSDLSALARDTHKFESRYLDGLVGPYPEAEDLYKERSPINHVESISCPMLVLQGEDDRVVPKSQSDMIVEALRKNGLPVAYLTFAGEGHGFRKAENVRRATEAQLYFYGAVFGFKPADVLSPIEIENSEALQK